MESSDSRLLEGILSQAVKTAQKTEQEAQLQAQRILDEAKVRANHEIELELNAHKQKLQQVDLRLQANMSSAKRKASLRQIDESYQSVLRRVHEKLNGKTIAPHLAKWIAEAAIGLDLKEAKVAFNAQCPVDEATLKEACDLVKNATGSEVKLILDPKPIRSLGVVLSSLDDSVSFNNQVEIRLRRYDRVIRTMIQEHT